MKYSKSDVRNEKIGKLFEIYSRIKWQIGKHWKARIDYTKGNFDRIDGDLFDARIINFGLKIRAKWNRKLAKWRKSDQKR